MARLIDAIALLDYYGKWSNNNTEFLKPEVDGFIYAQPTVDAVEVIRCHSCQSHEPCEVRNRIWCKKLSRFMKEDGFCSEGKVKE